MNATPIELSPPPMGEVEFFNPTSSTVKAVVWSPNPPHQQFLIVWGPGEKQKIPACYLRAIQDVRNDVIMGGLAPQLVRTDIPNPPTLHHSLDAEGTTMREAANAVKKAEEAQALLQKAASSVAQAALAAKDKKNK